MIRTSRFAIRPSSAASSSPKLPMSRCSRVHSIRTSGSPLGPASAVSTQCSSSQTIRSGGNPAHALQALPPSSPSRGFSGSGGGEHLRHDDAVDDLPREDVPGRDRRVGSRPSGSGGGVDPGVELVSRLRHGPTLPAGVGEAQPAHATMTHDCTRHGLDHPDHRVGPRRRDGRLDAGRLRAGRPLQGLPRVGLGAPGGRLRGVAHALPVRRRRHPRDPGRHRRSGSGGSARRRAWSASRGRSAVPASRAGSTRPPRTTSRTCGPAAPAPPRWKQACVIFLVFFPLSVVANWAAGHIIPDSCCRCGCCSSCS